VECPACCESVHIGSLNAHLDRNCKDNGSLKRSKSEIEFMKRFSSEKVNTLITMKKSSGREIALRNEDLQEMNCPFELVKNALEPELADELAKDLMKEVKSTWTQSKWTVFENIGMTRRLTCVYDFDGNVARRSGTENTAESDAQETHQISPKAPDRLSLASHRIREIVRERHEARARLFSDADSKEAREWSPTFVLGNFYRDGSDNIGFHGDHLTRLGPRPIIAAISLGATRLFRWKPAAENDKRMFSAKLKHNMALIMWPGTQELWKHGIPPQSNGSLQTHPITGCGRLSFTFRMHKQEFYESSPLCYCQRRTALRFSVKSDKYFFKCNPAAEKTCNFFQWFG